MEPAELLLGSCPARQGTSDVLAPAAQLGAREGAQRSSRALPKETAWERVLQHTAAQQLGEGGPHIPGSTRPSPTLVPQPSAALSHTARVPLERVVGAEGRNVQKAPGQLLRPNVPVATSPTRQRDLHPQPAGTKAQAQQVLALVTQKVTAPAPKPRQRPQMQRVYLPSQARTKISPGSNWAR